MKVNVDIPDSKLDEAAKEEIKSLRQKNARLFAQNEQLKRDIRELDHFQKQYESVRHTIIELAELMGAVVES